MRLQRRSFLRGLGVCVALPTLESILPVTRVLGAAPATPATTASGMPLRMGFVAFANGSHYAQWVPKGEGRDYELNEGFLALRGLKDKFQIITNLAHDAANSWGDGPGDHARIRLEPAIGRERHPIGVQCIGTKISHDPYPAANPPRRRDWRLSAVYSIVITN